MKSAAEIVAKALCDSNPTNTQRYEDSTSSRQALWLHRACEAITALDYHGFAVVRLPVSDAFMEWAPGGRSRDAIYAEDGVIRGREVSFGSPNQAREFAAALLAAALSVEQQSGAADASSSWGGKA